jgi:hypothetical protein
MTGERWKNGETTLLHQYKSRHCAINQNDEGTYDDRGRDGLTNFTLRIKEQTTRLTPFFT